MGGACETLEFWIIKVKENMRWRHLIVAHFLPGQRRPERPARTPATSASSPSPWSRATSLWSWTNRRLKGREATSFHGCCVVFLQPWPPAGITSGIVVEVLIGLLQRSWVHQFKLTDHKPLTPESSDRRLFIVSLGPQRKRTISSWYFQSSCVATQHVGQPCLHVYVRLFVALKE